MNRENLWTKKSVVRMYTSHLIEFYNKTVEVIEGYAKYEMEVPTKTTKRLNVLRNELIERGEIKSA